MVQLISKFTENIQISSLFILSVYDSMLVTKVVVMIYSILCLFTPRPPEPISFTIETIAVIISSLAYGIILMYLWSRPPMQQTLVQPLTMVIIMATATLGLKEYLISMLGNCFPALFQVINKPSPNFAWTFSFV